MWITLGPAIIGFMGVLVGAVITAGDKYAGGEKKRRQKRPKISARGHSRMKKGSITKFKLNPKKPPKTDWRAFDAMSNAERHQAALADPDCPPARKAQLARARRVPTVRA